MGIFQNKARKIEPIIDGVTDIRIIRFTESAWNQCFPQSKDKYQQFQRPDNTMEFLAGGLSGFLKKSKPDPSIRLAVKVLGDEYFSWLGERENTAEEREAYAKTEEASDLDRLEKEGLNQSIWVYGLPVVGISTGATVKTKLSQEISLAMQEYFSSVIDDSNFSVYAAPWLLSANMFTEEQQTLLSLEKAWRERHTIRYGKFDEIRVQGDHMIMLTFLPIIIRETHKNGVVTVGELYDYIGKPSGDDPIIQQKHLGRCLDEADFGEDVANARPGVKPLWEDTAGQLLEKFCAETFLVENEGDHYILPLLVPINGIPAFQLFFTRKAVKELKKAGRAERRASKKNNTFSKNEEKNT